MKKVSDELEMTLPILKTCPESIDDFFDEIGTNFYQIMVLITIALGVIHEGSQLAMISIVNVVYEHDPNFQGSSMSIFNSVFFAGNLIGAILGGPLSDKFGRKIPVTTNIIIMYLAALGLTFFTNFFLMCTFRCLYGLGMGLFSSIAFPFLAEVMPIKFRGMALAILGSVWTFGSIITILFSMAFSSTIRTLPWQKILFILDQTALVATISFIFYVVESPRHTFLVKKDFEQGLKELKMMQKRSNKSREYTEEEIESLRRWVLENNKQKSASFIEIFQGKYLKRTVLASITMFVLCIVYYGLSYITPLIYEKEKHNSETISLLYPSLAELVAVFFAITMIEMEYFGRKKSIIISNILCFISCIFVMILLFNNETGIYFWISVSSARLLADFGFIVLDCFICEIYSTRIRGSGLGFILAFGKLGSSVMPSILDALIQIGNFVPFIAFAILCLISFCIMFFLPKDTIGKELKE